MNSIIDFITTWWGSNHPINEGTEYTQSNTTNGDMYMVFMGIYALALIALVLLSRADGEYGQARVASLALLLTPIGPVVLTIGSVLLLLALAVALVYFTSKAFIDVWKDVWTKEPLNRKSMY